MVQEQSGYSNNGKSSEPTNQFPKEKVQLAIGKQVQTQDNNVFNWQSGQKLKNDRYIIQRKLNLGGFADIYLARDIEENQDVIIKTLKNELRSQSDFDSFEENFVKEAMTLYKLRHPHIVQFRDIIKTSEGWCIVMEYIEGEDLKTWVKSNGPLSEKEALIYVRQIGEALIEVHYQGLLHRDVKPRNIIRSFGGLKAVLIDFGIARKYSPNKTEQHTPYLTEDFAPIEQYMKKYKRGAYTDVYALAATLYFLLTGSNATSSRERHDGEPLVHPQQLNPNISVQVNSAIVLGLQIHPQERPQSIQEWLALLPLDEGKNELCKTNNEVGSEPDIETKLPQSESQNIQANSTIPPQQEIKTSETIQQLINPQPPLANTGELPPLTPVFTSPASFLVALAISSWLGTQWISAGFWLVLVIILISISFFIVKGRRTEQLICLVVSSVIPTLVFFIFVPALRNWKPQTGVQVSLVLTILACLVGFSVMILYPQIYQFIRDIFRKIS